MMKLQKLKHGILALAAGFALATGTALGMTIDENWMPEWIGGEDYENGYYYYPVAITCSERDMDSDYWRKLNNGCSLKVGRTNAQGVTKFTVSYLDEYGRKQTVSHSWRDDEGGVDFDSKGHHYRFNWDATPYGAWLDVDPVYDANGYWISSVEEHFYVIDTKGSGDVAIPAEWQRARTLNGLYGEWCGEGAEGTARLKCGKANKKGIAKVSLTITPFAGKKRTYRSVAVNVSQGDSVEVRWEQLKYAVTIDGDDFFGEPIYGEWRPACSPNAVWSANVGGSFNKTARFDFGDVPDDWTVMDRMMFVDSYDSADIFDPVAVTMSNAKWTCPAAPKLGSIRLYAHSTNVSNGIQEWALKNVDDIGNIPALKLSYNAKTGIFKGRFNIYCDGRKKYSAMVQGVMVDGEGRGLAICKRLSSEPWVVTIR